MYISRGLRPEKTKESKPNNLLLRARKRNSTKKTLHVKIHENTNENLSNEIIKNNRKQYNMSYFFARGFERIRKDEKKDEKSYHPTGHQAITVDELLISRSYRRYV